MSTDLKSQIGKLFEDVQRSQKPVTLDEVEGFVGKAPEARRGRSRWSGPLVAVGVMAIVLVVGGGLGLLVRNDVVSSSGSLPAPPLGVLTVPEVGETEPGFLDDGRPVFVVHDLDGTVRVIDGISTHLIYDQMAWCPSSRTFNDVFHGARWDAQGRYVIGPAPTDLGSYMFRPTSDGSAVVVTDFVEPAGRSIVSDGEAGPSCLDSPDSEALEVHPFWATSIEFRDYVSPVPRILLDEADETVWQRTALRIGLGHCAAVFRGEPTRYSVEYADEKESAFKATGESLDEPAGTAQTLILYAMLADEAAELFICPTLVND